MASGAGVTLDNVTIEIESNSNKAVDGIKDLSAALSGLKNAISGGFNNLEKLSESLRKINSVSKNMDNLKASMSGFKDLGKSLQSLDGLSGGRGFKQITESLGQLQSTMRRLDSKALEHIGLVADELAKKLKPLANEMKNISDGYRSLNRAANKYGVSLSSISAKTSSSKNFVKEFGNSFVSVAKGLGTTGKNIGKVFSLGYKSVSALEKPVMKTTSKLKQMGMALLSVRSIFTFTRKAINEYLQLDVELQKSLTNTWRAMGAQLAPAVEFAANAFHQFVRVIYSIILALTGIDLISRANEKAMKGWGNAAKKTLGNLQKFDDLNVVKFPESGSGDDNKLIDMQTIDLSPIQKIIDWVKKMRDEIKKALDTGKWSEVGKVFGEGINNALTGFLTFLPKVQDKLKEVAQNFGDFLNGAISEVHWEDIGKSIGTLGMTIRNTITEFLQRIHFDELGQGINKALQEIPFEDILSSFTTLWITVGESLLTTLKEINWDELGTKIHDGIKNQNWKKLGETILQLLWEGIKGIFELLGSAFESDNEKAIFKGIQTGLDKLDIKIDVSGLEKVYVILNRICKALIIIGGLAIIKMFLSGKIGDLIDGIKSKMGLTKKVTESAAKSGTSFTGFFDKLGTATEIIAILGGVALVIKSLTELITQFKESGISLGEAAGIMSSALGSIAIAFAGIAAATKLMTAGDALEIIAVFGGMAAVILSVGYALSSMAKAGLKTGDVVGMLAAIGLTMVGIMTAVAFIGPLMYAGLVPFEIVMATLLATLVVMAATLPIILDAAADFIERTAPDLQKTLTIIFDGIEKIIRAIGDVLPPIIEAVGDVFTDIFDGISNVIESVGNTWEKMLNAVANTVDSLANTILKFVREIGPAIENSIDAIIRSITKLINFAISGISYMINDLVLRGVNGLLGKLNNSKIGKALKLDWSLGNVYIPPFAPKLATGTNEIPDEGLYHLHPGEAVVPKKYNPALGNGTNEETNRRLDTLIDIMENLSFTNIVNLGNDQLYKAQSKFDRQQNNRYGTVVR